MSGSGQSKRFPFSVLRLPEWMELDLLSRSHTLKGTEVISVPFKSDNGKRRTSASACLTLAAALSEPTLAVSPSVVLGKPTPDSGFLIRLECVEKAFFLDCAYCTDHRCLLDHVDGWACRSDREEDVRVGVTASRELSPIGEGEHAAVSLTLCCGGFGGRSPLVFRK